MPVSRLGRDQMRTIYSYRKHRLSSVITLVVTSLFLGAFTAISAIGLLFGIGKAMMTDARPDYVLLVIQGAFAGIGVWGLFWRIRFYLSIPRAVNLIDGDQVEFLTRRGVETFSPGEFKTIRYVTHDEDIDYMRVRASTKTWYLPVNPGEAEEFMGTMSALNPDIRIKRV